MTDVVHLHIEHRGPDTPGSTLREREASCALSPATRSPSPARLHASMVGGPPDAPQRRAKIRSIPLTGGQPRPPLPPMGHATRSHRSQPGRLAPRRPPEATSRHPVPEGDLHRLVQNAPDDMRRAIALASNGGLRSAEIAMIEWGDLDPGTASCGSGRAKGSKGRSVTVCRPHGRARVRRERSDHRTHPDRQGLSQWIGRYMRTRGVDYTAHKLRARYATRFLAATGDLKAAAPTHSATRTCRASRYVVASSDTMRRGAEAAGRIG